MNTENTTSQEDTTRLEEAVLSAAHKLQTYQLNALRAERNYSNAYDRLRMAGAARRKAKDALFEAELRHARSVCANLEAEKARQAASQPLFGLQGEHYRALKSMLRACASGDRATIIDAAKSFSSSNTELNDANRRELQASVLHATAFVNMQDTETALAEARKQFEEAESAVAEAEAEERVAAKFLPSEREDLRQLQMAVAEAAAAFGDPVVKETFRPLSNSELELTLPNNNEDAPQLLNELDESQP